MRKNSSTSVTALVTERDVPGVIIRWEVYNTFLSESESQLSYLVSTLLGWQGGERDVNIWGPNSYSNLPFFSKHMLNYCSINRHYIFFN